MAERSRLSLPALPREGGEYGRGRGASVNQYAAENGMANRLVISGYGKRTLKPDRG